jgi:hypothetical protein
LVVGGRSSLARPLQQRAPIRAKRLGHAGGQAWRAQVWEPQQVIEQLHQLLALRHTAQNMQPVANLCAGQLAQIALDVLQQMRDLAAL